jgi:AcrR family transcriptional regulator
MARPLPRGRREAILAAARSEFAARGFAAARLDDIAVRVGISKAALYLQFADKAALFRALIESLIDTTLPRLMPPSFDALPADQQLQVVVQAAITHITSGDIAFLPRLIIGEGGNFPDLVRFYHDHGIARVLAQLETIIVGGIKTGTFRPVNAKMSARSIAGGIIFSAIWKTVFEPVGVESLDMDEMSKSHVDLLLRGFLTRPEKKRAL